MTKANRFAGSFSGLNITAARLRNYALTAGVALGLAAPAAVSAAPLQCKTKLSATDHVIALNAVQNLVGLYAGLSEEHGDNSVYIEDLFAMKTEGVSWKIGRGPVGIEQMKARFESLRKNPEVNLPGNLHLHSMMTPVIEVAEDGKTAQGVWDSFGPAIHSLDSGTTWLWIKYGVDFVKEDGVWKIWHMEVFPVFSTPWAVSPTDNAKAIAERKANPPAATTPPRAPRAPNPETANWQGTKDPTWSYDGQTNFRGPNLPEPTCTYDPAKSSAEYAPGF
jgi:hypothetical protein